MNINGVEHKEHHTSLTRGYVLVKNSEQPKPYKGKYGQGYTIKSHNPNSTRFCFLTYYIK